MRSFALDGFKNNLPAAEILNDHGANKCFFVNPDISSDSNYETDTAFVYHNDSFYDGVHLNNKGAEIFTGRFISDLKNIVKTKDSF